MSDVIGILETWDEAQQAEGRKDYSSAARLYRLCHLYYTHGELSFYNEGAAKRGLRSWGKQKDMLRKLTPLKRNEIMQEYRGYLSEHGLDKLSVFVWNQYQKIKEENTNYGK